MMRPNGSPEFLENRRKKAVRLSRKGASVRAIAFQVGVAERSVRRWKALYREKGPAGLKAIPAPGRPKRK